MISIKLEKLHSPKITSKIAKIFKSTLKRKEAKRLEKIEVYWNLHVLHASALFQNSTTLSYFVHNVMWDFINFVMFLVLKDYVTLASRRKTTFLKLKTLNANFVQIKDSSYQRRWKWWVKTQIFISFACWWTVFGDTKMECSNFNRITWKALVKTIMIKI